MTSRLPAGAAGMRTESELEKRLTAMETELTRLLSNEKYDPEAAIFIRGRIDLLLWVLGLE